MFLNNKRVAGCTLAATAILAMPLALAAGDGHQHHQQHAASQDTADPHAQHQQMLPSIEDGPEDPHAHHKAMMNQGGADAEDPHAHHKAMMGEAGADGEDPHAQHRAMKNKPGDAPESTRVDLLDNMMVDQNGRKVKFATDVVADRIVVMDFIYTNCPAVCPVISAIFSQVQTRLGDSLGKDVSLISISVDPIRDTPQRLKAYSAKHKARPGWIWLTGKKRRVDEVLDGLGAYSTNFEDHPPMVLVGDARSGEWSRFYGFPNPDRIMNQVEKLKAKRKMAM